MARRFNAGSKDKPNWVNKHEFQPSEAGMLARAERFPDFKGIQASAVYAEDDIIVDQGEGAVVHRFNPAKRKGALVGAWARVVRNQKLPVVVWLDFSGYVQQTPLWSKIPTTMIEKCARVAALRKAYPEAFGGLYIREEMPAEEFSAAPSDSESGTSAKPQPPSEPRPSSPPPADAPPSTTGVVAFGPHKAARISEMTDEALATTINLANEKLMSEPTARWAQAMRSNLAELETEVGRRCAAPSVPTANTTATKPAQMEHLPPKPEVPTGRRQRTAPAEREPGSDDGE